MIVPGISESARDDMDNWGEAWRFMSISARRFFGQVFRAEDSTRTTWGNGSSSLASLHGPHFPEFTKAEVDHWDHHYERVIGIRSMTRHDSSMGA